MIDKTKDLTDEWMPAFDLQTGTELRDDNHCPVCGGDSVDYQQYEADNHCVYQFASCPDCDSCFTLVYEFAGFTINNDGRFGKED